MLRVVLGERAKGHVESSRVCGPTLKHVGLPGSKSNTSLFQVQPSPEVPAPMYTVARMAVKHFFFFFQQKDCKTTKSLKVAFHGHFQLFLIRESEKRM